MLQAGLLPKDIQDQCEGVGKVKDCLPLRTVRQDILSQINRARENRDRTNLVISRLELIVNLLPAELTEEQTIALQEVSQCVFSCTRGL